VSNIKESESKGFTLVELMLAITILTYIASIVFTSFQSVQNNAWNARRKTAVVRYLNYLREYKISNGRWPTLIQDALDTMTTTQFISRWCVGYTTVDYDSNGLSECYFSPLVNTSPVTFSEESSIMNSELASVGYNRLDTNVGDDCIRISNSPTSSYHCGVRAGIVTQIDYPYTVDGDPYLPVIPFTFYLKGANKDCRIANTYQLAGPSPDWTSSSTALNQGQSLGQTLCVRYFKLQNY
jgi:prepilin-type N-terminal cleavage/methylation domain-containing protein